MGGAAILLLLGLINPADAFFTLMRDWNTFLFFLGMMGLSALAEAAGLFDWLAVQAARLAGKSAARLFLNVFLLGSLISMVLSNDATALILTPIVYVLVTKLRLPALPYLFACTFIADTASFLLIQHGFVAATMFGCDLGPNLTTVGSLATVLWLLILRQRNVDVSGLDYFKVGVVVTPLMLLAGALTMWLLL